MARPANPNADKIKLIQEENKVLSKAVTAGTRAESRLEKNNEKLAKLKGDAPVAKSKTPDKTSTKAKTAIVVKKKSVKEEEPKRRGRPPKDDKVSAKVAKKSVKKRIADDDDDDD